MLRLTDITKDYQVADTTVRALKGLTLAFRENEFVSILGPSGCGKTTLLNLIGGLDTYTSGDLFISGRSTKEFKDRDWDVYRNHRIGFIFQSYNLIPHQTILGNVELALTIAGMNKAERQAKAKLALDKVGLEGQYNKRPNQLSGGQCQRVAIARALVNDPEILLADEPTGALDTVTSEQIMQLIKEIAKEKLVIMVTHNPELAEEYSTRIIRLLDGELVSDTNPYSSENEIATTAKRNQEIADAQQAELLMAAEASGGKVKKVKKERAKMSIWTAFKLSLRNLSTKKARTALTSIAGSIGIIGVSLVLSLSYGIQGFITNMQNDMLSGYPIEINASGYDVSSMINSMSTGTKASAVAKSIKDGYINVDSLMETFVSSSASMENMLVTNNITKDYVSYVKAMPAKDAASISVNYGLDLSNNIYTDFYLDSDSQPVNLSLTALRTIYTSVLKSTDYAKYSTYINGLSNVFAQMPNSENYIMSQYSLKDGYFATEKDEVMIVLKKGDELSDLLLAQLGYYTQEQYINLIKKAGHETGEDGYNAGIDKESFSYDEIKGRSFIWYPNETIFKTASNPLLGNTFDYEAYYNDSFTGGVELKIVGILEPKDNVSYGSLSSGFFYTEALTDYILQTNYDSAISTYLRTNESDSFSSMKIETNGFTFYTGVTFKYSYTYDGDLFDNQIGFVGRTNMMMAMIENFVPGLSFGETFTLSQQQLGGKDTPSDIYVYPVDFSHKDAVYSYLDKWNSDEDITIYNADGSTKVITADEREDVTYTDNLATMMSMVADLINIITIALVGFTALSLVVSCVMIAIITYVSVVERIKEIGVIRSLGGRKRDVSYLFNAETFVIGLISGIIGIAFTYFATLIINLVVGGLIGVTIANFPWHYAVIMLCVSIVLTLVSGIIPSMSAAKKDPVVALRTE